MTFLFAGGPGTFQPDLMHIEEVLILLLLIIAYRKELYQFIKEKALYIIHKYFRREVEGSN